MKITKKNQIKHKIEIHFLFYVFITIMEHLPKIDCLPKEIIENILEFHGFYKWRNGKYMAQFYEKDPRYHILKKIPPIVKNIRGIYYNVTIHPPKKNYYWIINTRIYGGFVHWYMDVVEKAKKKELDISYRCIHFIIGRHKKQNMLTPSKKN